MVQQELYEYIKAKGVNAPQVLEVYYPYLLD